MPGYRQIYRGNPEQKLYYLVKNFSGGMNTSDVDDEVRDNEFRELKNVELSTRGLLQNRKGFGELELLNELLAPLNIPSGHVSLLKVIKNKNSALRKIVESTDLNYFNTTYALQEMELQILILIDNKLYLIKVEKEADNEISTSISTILTLTAVNSYKDRVNTIETIDYAQFVYFSTSDISSELEGIIKYDVDKEEAELIDKENAYKPSAYEVVSSQDLKGFNVIAENPLQWIRPSETGFREVLGLFLTKDGTYLTKVPEDGVFDVNVIYSGSFSPYELEIKFIDQNKREIGYNITEIDINSGFFKYSILMNIPRSTTSFEIDVAKKQSKIKETFSLDPNYMNIYPGTFIISRNEFAVYERKSTGLGYLLEGWDKKDLIISRFIENLDLDFGDPNTLTNFYDGFYNYIETYPDLLDIGTHRALYFNESDAVLVYADFDGEHWSNIGYEFRVGSVQNYVDLPNPPVFEPPYNHSLFYTVKSNNKQYTFDVGGALGWFETKVFVSSFEDILISDGDVVYVREDKKYYKFDDGNFVEVSRFENINQLRFRNFGSFPQEGEIGFVYIDISTQKGYRWLIDEYIEIVEETIEFNPIIPLLGQYFDIGDTLNQDEIENIDLKDVNITMIENRLVLYKGNTIWFSDLYRFDYFPNLNFHILPLKLSDEIVAIKFFRGSHIIFTKDTIWKMTGTWGNEMNIEIINGYIGAISPRSIRSIENSLFFMSREGLYRLMANYYADGLENVSRVDNLIRDLIPKDEDLDSILYNSQYWLLTQDNEDFDSVKYYYSIDLEKASKHPFTIDKYSIKPDLFMQFDSALYTIKNGKFYLFDKGYTDFGDGYETIIQTAKLSLGYPTHDKKYKNIYIKTLANRNIVVPLYLTSEVDGYIVIDPNSTEISLDDEGQLIYTVSLDPNKDTNLKTYTAQLGLFELDLDRLGESKEQTHKVVVSGKGKNISLRIMNKDNDFFGITDIGHLHKLGKVRESR